jgi:hypothetical protein
MHVSQAACISFPCHLLVTFFLVFARGAFEDKGSHARRLRRRQKSVVGCIWVLICSGLSRQGPEDVPSVLYCQLCLKIGWEICISVLRTIA